MGTALIQFAIEKSIKEGFGGKIKLHSTNGSSVFYYKLGFKCLYDETQKRVESAYVNHQIGPDGGDMYLPDEAIEAWKEKIKENPIMLQ